MGTGFIVLAKLVADDLSHPVQGGPVGLKLENILVSQRKVCHGVERGRLKKIETAPVCRFDLSVSQIYVSTQHVMSSYSFTNTRPSCQAFSHTYISV